MTLELSEVRRIAEDVARAEGPSVDVIAATTSARGSDYIELTLRIHGDGDEPSLIMVGADRSGGEAEFRGTITRELRRRLRRTGSDRLR
jgi:hypothetical protein